MPAHPTGGTPVPLHGADEIAERAFELVVLAQRPGPDAPPAQICGEVGGKTVDREDAARLDEFDIAEEIRVSRRDR